MQEEECQKGVNSGQTIDIQAAPLVASGRDPRRQRTPVAKDHRLSLLVVTSAASLQITCYSVSIVHHGFVMYVVIYMRTYKIPLEIIKTFIGIVTPVMLIAKSSSSGVVPSIHRYSYT